MPSLLGATPPPAFARDGVADTAVAIGDVLHAVSASVIVPAPGTVPITMPLPLRVPGDELGIVDVAAALAHLEGIPSARLDRLLRETLDLASHRLDAWITSLATHRLAELRGARASGIHIAAYGWVHDLKPAAVAQSGGYVHCPSVSHAATAAVLRSAHMARGGGSELAIDLSSARVRIARRVLDGVRAGQSVGGMLGTLLEEHLAAHGGQAAIGAVRTLAPLAGSVGSGAVPGGCDGELLLRALEHGQTSAAAIAAASGVPPGGARSAVAVAVTAAVAALGDASDAIGDLLVAESVHQLARHNLPRAAAAMAASSGGPPPEDYDVLRIAPAGVGVAHRAVVLYRGTAPTPSSAVSARGLVDPFVERWMAGLLGPLSSIAVTAVLDDRSTTRVSVADLQLSAADVVALAGAAHPARPSGDPQLAAKPPLVRLLESQLHARSATRGRRVVTLDPAGAEHCLTIARTIAATLAAARPFDVHDVPATGGQPGATADLGDLKARLAAAVARANAAISEVMGGLATDARATPAVLRALQVVLVHAGMSAAAISDVAIGATDERAALIEHLRRCVDALGRRATAAGTQLRALDGAPPSDDLHERLRAVGELLFGEKMLLTTQLRSATLDACLDHPPSIGGDASDATRQRTARRLLVEAAALREPLGHLRRLRQLVQATGKPAPGVDLLQLTSTIAGGDPWAGIGDRARIANRQPAVSGGRISLLRLASGLTDSAGAPMRGLVFDEWNETVPAPTVASALAVHANRPSNEAPQAILLAVPPDPAAGWSQAIIETILHETFEMAAIRAVDLPALGSLGQVVPMLHLPLAGLSLNKELLWHDLVRR